MSKFALAILLLAAALTAPVGPFAASASADSTDQLRSDEPEAWAMFYFTSVTLFSGLGTPRYRETGSFELSLELGNIPSLNMDQRTVGFGGTKVEDLNNAPLIGRPILTIGLPLGVGLSIAWVPPIRLFGVRANLVALAIERPLFEQGPWSAGLRVHGEIGSTKGDFTCPGHTAKFEPGSDGNPFGCEGTSNDKAIQRYAGAELSGSYRIDALRGLTPYVALGANFLAPEFRVHAQTFGEADRTKVSSDTWTVSLGAGVTLPLREDCWFSLGVFYSPLWVTRPPKTTEDRDSLVNVRAELTSRLW